MSLLWSQIARFGVVGIAATAVHYAILVLGTETMGVSPVLMTGVAFCAAVIVTYLGQRLWVFKVRQGGAGQLMRFGVSVVSGLIGNVAIMACATQILGASYRLGFIAGLVIVPALTFVLNKLWVFAEKEDPGHA